MSPLVAAAVVAVSACSSPAPKFQDDQLLSSAPNQFSRSFNYASTDACEASRRAMLSQGYMTTMTHNDTVDATKNFQPGSDSHVVVEVHVVCTDGDASNSSMVYVNAVQNGYALKKSDTSASVGLSILGSVSLPIRSNSDAMVKISSETIQSSAFYDRFFELVGRYLGTAARSEAVPDSGVIKVTPLPPPVEVPAAVAPAVTASAPATQPAMAAAVAAPVALVASGVTAAQPVASAAVAAASDSAAAAMHTATPAASSLAAFASASAPDSAAAAMHTVPPAASNPATVAAASPSNGAAAALHTMPPATPNPAADAAASATQVPATNGSNAAPDAGAAISASATTNAP